MRLLLRRLDLEPVARLRDHRPQTDVYDSFQGLPTAEPGDKYASKETEGFLNADIDRVKRTVAQLGAFDSCEFHKGWFADTLPHHDRPIVLCFLDVDYQSSLRDCVLNLWPT